jgi:hypothetical protein
MTHPAFWARNSLYRSSADCLALNILQWISIISLLQLVSHGVNVGPPVADPDSVAQVRTILDQAERGDNGVPLFGSRLSDLRERLDRRFERVEALMGSCARRDIVDKTLNSILARLYKLRQDAGAKAAESKVAI